MDSAAPIISLNIQIYSKTGDECIYAFSIQMKKAAVGQLGSSEQVASLNLDFSQHEITFTR